MKSSMEEIILKMNKLDDDCTVELGSFIQGSRWIKKLDLSHNNITDEGIKRIAKSMENNMTISSLDLQGNLNITDNSASVIRDMVSQSCISSIYLNNTKISNQMKTEFDELSKTTLCKRSKNFENMKHASTKWLDQFYSGHKSPRFDVQENRNLSEIKSGIDFIFEYISASHICLEVNRNLQEYQKKVVNIQMQMENENSTSIVHRKTQFVQLFLKKEEIENRLKQKVEKNKWEERKKMEIERDSITISVINSFTQLKANSNLLKDCIQDNSFNEFANLESQIIKAEELVNKLKDDYDERSYASFQCPPSSLIEFNGFQFESDTEELDDEQINVDATCRKMNELEPWINQMVNINLISLLKWSKNIVTMKEKYRILSKSKKDLGIKILEIEEELEKYGLAIEHQNESMIKLKEIEELEKVIDKKEEEINLLELRIKEKDIDITRKKKDLSKTELDNFEKELKEMQEKMNEVKFENEELSEELNKKCEDKNGNCIFPDRIRSNISTQKNLLLVPKILKINSKRCELLEKIGDGAFSTVFKAKISRNGRFRDNIPVVAFKQFIISSFSAKEKELEMVEREIEMLGHLEHDNIVKISGVVGDINAKDVNEKLMGVGFLMEYCKNGSLRQLLDKKTNNNQHQQLLNMDLIIHLLYGAAQGLEYLHSFVPNVIIHGDIKSDNILIDKEYNAKLCDFGISKLQQTTMASTKGGGNIGGTLIYKAPETFDGKMECKSDVYSFGCVILEMLTGQRPWASLGNNPMRIMQKLYSKEQHDLSKIRADVKEKLVDLMRRCLDYDKDKRPTIAEARVELEKMVKHAVLIELDNKSDEYNKVENLFFPGGDDKEGSLNRNDYRIVRIDKIRHPFAEKRYHTEIDITQSVMTKNTPSLSMFSRSLSSFSSTTSSFSTQTHFSAFQVQNEVPNERLLFHGTSETNPMEILNHPDAFMKDYSSQGFYGRGLYFAEKARYPNAGYRYNIPKTDQHQLLVCLVICGDSVDYGTTVDDNTRGLTQKELEGKFDSVHAGPHQPDEPGPGEDDSDMYVVYKDSQVAPRFLITYESTQGKFCESEIDEVESEFDDDDNIPSSYSDLDDDLHKSQGEIDDDDISI